MSALIARPALLRTPAQPLRVAGRLAGGLLLRFGVLALLVLLWQWAAARTSSLFFPTPAEIVARIHHDWFSGPAAHLFLTHSVATDIVPSLGRMLAGWILGSVIGVAVGVFAGESRVIRQVVDPPAQFLRALPTPAIVPVFLLLFGASTSMRILLIAFGCVWPVLLNTMNASAAVDPQRRSSAKAMHLGRARQLFLVVLPSTGPAVAAGMRIGLALGLILMVLSEWVVSTSGLGFTLITAQQHFDMTGMWAAMVALAIAGYLINTVFLAVEKRVLRWHEGARGK